MVCKQDEVQLTRHRTTAKSYQLYERQIETMPPNYWNVKYRSKVEWSTLAIHCSFSPQWSHPSSIFWVFVSYFFNSILNLLLSGGNALYKVLFMIIRILNLGTSSAVISNNKCILISPSFCISFTYVQAHKLTPRHQMHLHENTDTHKHCLHITLHAPIFPPNHYHKHTQTCIQTAQHACIQAYTHTGWSKLEYNEKTLNGQLCVTFIERMRELCWSWNTNPPNPILTVVVTGTSATAPPTADISHRNRNFIIHMSLSLKNVLMSLHSQG